LAVLQRPDISHNGPAVIRRNSGGIAVHSTKTVGHHVVNVAIGLITQTLVVQRGRRFEAALHDHSVTVTGPGMAGCAENIVPLLPAQQQGIFTLTQTGTLVNGTYTLEGGWEGSLQGTLINRKIFLVRIDSRKGRMMELEGYLAADEISIRGTWLSYEVLGGDGSRGQWSADKLDTE